VLCFQYNDTKFYKNNQTNSLAAHFAKRNTKFGGGGKARAGKNSFPPTPFLFARPSGKVLMKIQNPDFRQKKVRILTKRHRQFLEFGFWAITASPRLWRGEAENSSCTILRCLLDKVRNYFEQNPND